MKDKETNEAKKETFLAASKSFRLWLNHASTYSNIVSISDGGKTTEKED